jgi:putative DNA (cytosine-5-)-methyltransferase
MTLIGDPGEKTPLLGEEPQAERWVRKFLMGEEFINGDDRYCLWLSEITAPDLKRVPKVRERVEPCREWRLEQTSTGDAYKLANRYHLLRPTSKSKDGIYIGIPKVSSGRRKYIPAGFADDGMIPGDKLYFMPTGFLFVFETFMSQFHNAWMRAVGGRLKSEYSYGNTTICNNFVWLDSTDCQQKRIEECALAAFDERTQYEGSTLADLYDPDNEFLYSALVKARQKLDKEVETAYEVDFDGYGHKNHCPSF